MFGNFRWELEPQKSYEQLQINVMEYWKVIMFYWEPQNNLPRLLLDEFSSKFQDTEVGTTNLGDNVVCVDAILSVKFFVAVKENNVKQQQNIPFDQKLRFCNRMVSFILVLDGREKRS